MSLHHYAWVLNGAVDRYEARAEPYPSDHPKLVEGVIRPAETEEPAFDADAEALDARTETIEAGRVVRSWSVRALTVEEARSRRRAQLDAAYAQAQAAPFAWDFGETPCTDKLEDGADLGAAGPQTLQMRGEEDKGNWTAVGASAGLSIALGDPTRQTPIKTTANVWVLAPASQVFAALVAGEGAALSLAQRYTGNLSRYGARKDALAAAETVQAVLDVPLGGWL